MVALTPLAGFSSDIPRDQSRPCQPPGPRPIPHIPALAAWRLPWRLSGFAAATVSALNLSSTDSRYPLFLSTPIRGTG